MLLCDNQHSCCQPLLMPIVDHFPQVFSTPAATRPLLLPPLVGCCIVVYYHHPLLKLCAIMQPLGWECCQHVGNMSARQPNVGTFGWHSPVVPTQNWSWHSIFVLGMADIYPFLLLVPEVRTHNPPKTSTYVVVLVYRTIGAQSKVLPGRTN